MNGTTDALRRLGAAHRTDAERVPLARARGRVLAEALGATGPEGGDSPRFAGGHRLEPADLGRLAAAGLAEAPCARRPTVAVFTSGDGLRPAGQALREGERVDACRPVLMALLSAAGLEPVAWPILPGDPARARAALEDAAQAFDLVVACSEIGVDGAPRLASLLARVPAVREADLAAGPFGARAPASLLLVLGEDAAGLAARWPATGGALLDALQGLRVEAPEDVERPTDVDVAEAAAWRDRGARLIDVREPEEQALGVPEGAETWPLSGWGSGADGVPPVADPATPVLLVCASGVRSVRAAALLRERGFRDVASVRGGVAAWRAAGLPLVVPATAGLAATAVALTDDGRERYDRHLRLGAVGIEGQRRLLAATVVIVGAGGLGSPAAFYLAAAGVGRLVLIDDDRVERSNLQRQILHVDAAVGRPKVTSARERLLALNPTLAIDARDCRLGPDNVEALLQGADVVIDGSDNFTARYLVDAACVRLGIPLVHGAVERFTGQVTVFDAGRQRGVAPCYRCLFPDPPGADAAPNCAEAGVLGVLPGLVGLLQATEALKLLLGIGETLVGRLLTIDALGMRVREIALAVDPACPGCGPDARFDGYAAIETVCASR